MEDELPEMLGGHTTAVEWPPERIGEPWAFTSDHSPVYASPTIIVAGRLDSTVGYAAAADPFDEYPHASLAVVDDAGHALPHE